MDRPVAEILAARCKPAIQDQLYANPVTDPECSCQTCRANPPTPRPTQCRCSGCLPETSSEVYTPSPKTTKAVSNIPQGQRLTKDMKLVGTSRLEQFRVLVWSEAVDQSMALTPLADFLPDVTIKFILDNFAQFKSAADLLTVVQNIVGMAGQHERLYNIVVELKGTFLQMKKDKAAETKAAKATTQLILPVINILSVYSCSHVLSLGSYSSSSSSSD
jgi:hypothetical protein